MEYGHVYHKQLLAAGFKADSVSGLDGPAQELESYDEE